MNAVVENPRTAEKIDRWLQSEVRQFDAARAGMVTREPFCSVSLAMRLRLLIAGCINTSAQRLSPSFGAAWDMGCDTILPTAIFLAGRNASVRIPLAWRDDGVTILGSHYNCEARIDIGEADPGQQMVDAVVMAASQFFAERLTALEVAQ